MGLAQACPNYSTKDQVKLLLCIKFTYYAQYYAHVKDLCLLKSDCSIRVYPHIGLKEAATANVFPVNNFLTVKAFSLEQLRKKSFMVCAILYHAINVLQ